MSDPTLGDHVKWLTDPDAKGPHRFTFGTVTAIADPDDHEAGEHNRPSTWCDGFTWEILLADDSVRYVIPEILAKVPGRHVAKA